MKKTEFMSTMASKLSSLPVSEIEKTLGYYAEMIDDRIEEGMDEEAAVNDLGDMDDIVEKAKLSAPLTSLVKAKIKPKNKLKAWQIVLIAVGSPVWFPLLLAAVIIVFAMYVVVWSVIASIWAVVASFAIYGVVGFIYSFVVLAASAPAGLFQMGSALVSAGLSILLFFAAKELTRLLIKLTKIMMNATKKMFIPKDRKEIKE